MAVFDEIREIIASKLSVDPDNIKPESSFTDDLGADSLDLADLMMAIEERYQLEFSNEETEKFKTVGDVAGAIDRARGEG
ncbi:acyl carrier protein [bacterium]|nr:acyl carrier protein [bacterium]